MLSAVLTGREASRGLTLLTVLPWMVMATFTSLNRPTTPFAKASAPDDDPFVSKITGALVQRHPFGGYKMSGIGSKAGGPDYLLQFLIPVNVSENTMRRGFAPKVDGKK